MARIVVVDPDQTAAEFCRRVLTQAGHEVVTAACLKTASRVMVLTRPDVVISELHLLNSSGLDFLHTIPDSGLASRLVITADDDSARTAMRAIRLGAFDYLVKPLSLSELVDTVSAATQTPLANGVPSPVAQEWARMMAVAVNCLDDPRTIRDWCRAAGMSATTLKNRCRAAGIPSKASLDLARLLRAVICGRAENSPPELFLEADPRTFKRLSASAGIECERLETIPIPSLLLEQQLVTHTLALKSLSDALASGLKASRRQEPTAPSDTRSILWPF